MVRLFYWFNPCSCRTKISDFLSQRFDFQPKLAQVGVLAITTILAVFSISTRRPLGAYGSIFPISTRQTLGAWRPWQSLRTRWPWLRSKDFEFINLSPKNPDLSQE